MIRRLRNQDALAGALLMAFGLLSLYLAAGFPMGTAAHMGPGYFPKVVGVGIVILGLVILGRGFLQESEALPRFHWRPIVMVVGGIVLFGLFIDRLGLFVSAFMLIVLARLGGPDRSGYVEILLQYALASIGVAVIFIYLLQIPIPLLPR